MPKKFRWFQGLSDHVRAKVLRWDNGYENGTIHKSKRVPHQRFGIDLPETQILMRIHTIELTYSQAVWLRDVLIEEDPNTTQSAVFIKLVTQFEERQRTKHAVDGAAQAWDIALTKDEVGYIRRLLDCIKLGRPTPSQRLEASKDIEKADW